MWKKWFNIVLCLWLINAVTCYHATNPFDDVAEVAGSDHCASACVTINTWADYISNAVADDSDAIIRKFHKIKMQRRYVHARAPQVNLFLPAVLLACLYILARKRLAVNAPNYPAEEATRPAYYNFLFRLSPF
ncbi:hypothetical protein GCM10027037_31170 [Mucilaginibacter koreensis]